MKTLGETYFLKRGMAMTKRISYNRLWKLLIDKGMNKKDLKRVSGVSTTSIAKMTKGESVTTTVLLKICEALNCEINDIMESVEIPQVTENHESKI
jgi:DNA-binding Xre family transcriptional regulator